MEQLVTYCNAILNDRLSILNYDLQVRVIPSKGKGSTSDATPDIDYQRVLRERFPVICYVWVSSHA